MIIISSATKTPNKAAAFNTIRTLIEDNAQQDTAEVSLAALKELFLYFAPSQPAKPKTAEQWVARAVGTKDIRPQVNYLYSDGKRLAGTDGHRLHWCPTTLEPGFYCPKTFARVTADETFPPIDRAIPEPMDTDTVWAGSVVDLDKIAAHNGFSYNFGEDLPAVQCKYLDDAQPVSVRLRGAMDSIRGSSAFGEFVIMPIKK